MVALCFTVHRDLCVAATLLSQDTAIALSRHSYCTIKTQLLGSWQLILQPELLTAWTRCGWSARCCTHNVGLYTRCGWSALCCTRNVGGVQGVVHKMCYTQGVIAEGSFIGTGSSVSLQGGGGGGLLCMDYMLSLAST